MAAVGMLGVLAGCGGSSDHYSVNVSSDFSFAETEAVLAGLQSWQAVLPRLTLGITLGQCSGKEDVCMEPSVMDRNVVGETFFGGGPSINHQMVRLDVAQLAGMDREHAVQQAAAHEMGHAMGLQHTDNGTLMAVALEHGELLPTSADLAQWYSVRR